MAIYAEDVSGSVLASGFTFRKPVTFAGGTGTAISVLPSSATVTLPVTGSTLFSHTPTQNETINAPTVVTGQTIRIVITTAGSSSYTLTFGTNFKSTGTLATGVTTGKVFVVEFLSDGVNYNEESRTTAM